MIDVTRLVERFGTPLFVYQLDRVDHARLALTTSLPEPSKLFYSLKANPHPDLVQRLGAGGCGAETSSIGELQVALDAGITPNRCLYTGPGKTDGEIETAIAAGVRLFSVESVHEVERLHRAAWSAGVTTNCLIRVNNEFAIGASGLRMAGGASQFGIDASYLLGHPEAFQGTPKVNVIGLHFFSASNVRDAVSLLNMFEANVKLSVQLQKAAGVRLDLLDLGGGFAAPYARPGDLPEYWAMRSQLEEILDAWLPDWRGGDPQIAFEAGRYLVATSGSLLARIMSIKRSGGRTFVSLDTGIHHLGGLSGLGRLLPLSSQPVCEHPGQAIRADLVGPLCTPADILGRDVELSACLPGEVVTIPNVGAYGPSASLLAFLSRPTPIEVVIDGGDLHSASRIELRRQTVQEALS